MPLTPRQLEAQKLLAGRATHILLDGGSRSGKTYLIVRAICMRAIKAANSRHAILRLRFNHLKPSIIFDTFPKVMANEFPGVSYDLSKSDWVARMPNASEVWFGGLDDKERTEKILGQEHATIFLNEVSQLDWSTRNMAVTRLAQRTEQIVDGRSSVMPLRMYYDCNPPNKGHWAYKVFTLKVDPETGQKLPDPENYVRMQMNPRDNTDNLAPEYIRTLESLPAHMRARFLEGVYADANPNALFSQIDIDKWRSDSHPQLVRVVVAVDPSGADEDTVDRDEIGIIIGGLGVDGNAYILEDDTVRAGPAVWGKVATDAYERQDADVIVGEDNFGGAMVKHTIQVARPRTPYKSVTASRGKVVRAEPFSALYAEGRVRHVGYFDKLEDELCGFSTFGYTGERSPNRADALFWVLAELFPSLVKKKDKEDKNRERQPFERQRAVSGSDWLAT